MSALCKHKTPSTSLMYCQIIQESMSRVTIPHANFRDKEGGATVMGDIK